VESRRFLPTPPALGATVRGDPGRIPLRSFASENQSPWAIVCFCLCNPIRLAVIVELRLVTDRQTDRQTQTRTQTQAHG